MLKIKIIIFGVILCISSYGRGIHNQISLNIRKLMTITSQTQSLNVNGKIYEVDMLELLEMTTMLESRYALDKYGDRIAKSPFQYELPTINFAMRYNENLKSYLESRLGHTIDPNNDAHSPYVAYLIYMTRLRHNKVWVDRYERKHSDENDIEWILYKSLYNSTLGKSTYNKWKERKKELNEIYDRMYNDILYNHSEKSRG